MLGHFGLQVGTIFNRFLALGANLGQDAAQSRPRGPKMALRPPPRGPPRPIFEPNIALQDRFWRPTWPQDPLQKGLFGISKTCPLRQAKQIKILLVMPLPLQAGSLLILSRDYMQAEIKQHKHNKQNKQVRHRGP